MKKNLKIINIRMKFQFILFLILLFVFNKIINGNDDYDDVIKKKKIGYLTNKDKLLNKFKLNYINLIDMNNNNNNNNSYLKLNL